MRVRVIHGIDDLASDIASIGARAPGVMKASGNRSAKYGLATAKRLAREKAGIHGIHYWKRITLEARGPLSWEYGPEGIPKTNFVGVGFRHGVNTDLPQSADVMGPKAAKDVLDAVDGMFW